MEVCKALNALGFKTCTGKLSRHPQQIVKLLGSFAPTQKVDDSTRLQSETKE